MWVFNSTTESIERRSTTFVPGLYKIFDEIIVNAADHKQQDRSMTEIKVWVNREEGEIAVRNNGRGIPVEIHDKQKIYIPEMIFGHLLTGSNYNDNEKKVVGGRNGYGAKLCNIFSTEFTLETADSANGKKYKQTWRKNMSVMEKAKITSNSRDDYTMIKFKPDFARFGMTEMDDDFEALVKRRVYDLAGTCTGVKVSLNDQRIKITKFKQYMEMYTKALDAIKSEAVADLDLNLPAPDSQVILTDSPHERWEVGFAVSDGAFQQVSFVNSIATTSGGSHVNYIADQIVTKLLELMKKKNKGGVTLKAAQIKNHMFLFVNCQIENPAFTSQSKEQLTTKPSAFGSKCPLSDKFLKQIEKSGIMDNIMNFAQKRADQILKKSDGNRRSRITNRKLTDANWAGTKDGHRCTLVLTEGNSAAALALTGRDVIGHNLVGVYPLRGKLLNVRDASIDQISKNEEIQNIKKFLGLQHKKEYADTKGLRYGHLMIMTDQDTDGSHIKGLLINLFQCQFPSLLRIPGFLQEFITPIVKVWKTSKHAVDEKKKISFFTMPEYESWKEQPGHSGRLWAHKYYKGLGTNDALEARDYFENIDKHLIKFAPLTTTDNQLIDLVFSKKKADERKLWLENYVPGTYLDMANLDVINYDDFVNKELILFSLYDNQRSIPSVIDGLKPGQRKIIYTCLLKREGTKAEKVSEIQGRVSSLTAYAHGPAALEETIVAMAQNFCGSNNINLLMPNGNFGSRLAGGSDHASSRYIYTQIAPITKHLYHAADEPLLKYNEDDGKTIEPCQYVPVIPMLLVNGADGIGTGWSTSIPSYNPTEIIENLRRRMKGSSKADMVPMHPWFRGWTGETEVLDNGRKYKFKGIIHCDDETNEVEVSELPARMWTNEFSDRYKELTDGDKMAPVLKDYAEYNNDMKVRTVLMFHERAYKEYAAKPNGFEDLLKMSKSATTSNLVAFDRHGRIHKYDTPLDIMEEFYHVRLDLYAKRKTHSLDEMNKKLRRLTNQARFIKMIIDNKLVVSKKKKQVLIAELQEKGFERFPKIDGMQKKSDIDQEDNNEEAEEIKVDPEAGVAVLKDSDYDYLLGMAIWSLTQERVDQLLRQIGTCEEEIDVLTRKSPSDIWDEDLNIVQEQWKKVVEDGEDTLRRAAKSKKIRRASQKLGIGAGKGNKRKADDSDDYSEQESKRAKKKVPTTKTAVSKPAKASTAAQKSMSSWLEKDDKPRNQGTYEGLYSDGKPVPNLSTASTKAAARTSAKTATTVSKQVKKEVVRDEDGADSDFDMMAVKPSTSGNARVGRAATQKTKTYALNDDDGSDFDDKLDDIGSLVKGSSDRMSIEPLFSSKPAPARAPPRSAVANTLPPTMDTDDDDDWEKLAASSTKATKTPVADLVMLDDEDESIDMMATKASSKAKAPAKGHGVSKTKAAVPAKPLSPAAKVYAAKQAKARAAPPKALIFSDDDGNGDGDGDGDNGGPSDESVESASPPPRKSAAPARSARARVATKKSKYKIESDDDEDVDARDDDSDPSFD